jgi:hypothetical protein
MYTYMQCLHRYYGSDVRHGHRDEQKRKMKSAQEKLLKTRVVCGNEDQYYSRTMDKC